MTTELSNAIRKVLADYEYATPLHLRDSGVLADLILSSLSADASATGTTEPTGEELWAIFFSGSKNINAYANSPAHMTDGLRSVYKRGDMAIYNAVADAVCEVAKAAQEAFREAGIEPGEWDSDNIVKDVSRGIADDIARLREEIVGPRPEEKTMIEIGFIHRRRTGEIDFHQDLPVLPIGLHETIKVFMEQTCTPVVKVDVPSAFNAPQPHSVTNEADDYLDACYAEWLMAQPEAMICNGDDLVRRMEAKWGFDRFVAQFSASSLEPQRGPVK